MRTSIFPLLLAPSRPIQVGDWVHVKYSISYGIKGLHQVREISNRLYNDRHHRVLEACWYNINDLKLASRSEVAAHLDFLSQLKQGTPVRSPSRVSTLSTAPTFGTLVTTITSSWSAG